MLWLLWDNGIWWSTDEVQVVGTRTTFDQLKQQYYVHTAATLRKFMCHNITDTTWVILDSSDTKVGQIFRFSQAEQICGWELISSVSVAWFMVSQQNLWQYLIHYTFNCFESLNLLSLPIMGLQKVQGVYIIQFVLIYCYAILSISH